MAKDIAAKAGLGYARRWAAATDLPGQGGSDFKMMIMKTFVPLAQPLGTRPVDWTRSDTPSSLS